MAKKTIDYTDFAEKGSLKASKKQKAEADNDSRVQRWWEARTEDLPNAVMAQVQAIITNDRPRIDMYNTYAKLYGNQNPVLWNGYQVSKVNSNSSPVRDRISFNIIQSCVDTLTSKIAKNKPKPLFLTSKGNSKTQRKAKKLDDFVKGIFYENKLYEQAPLIFRDATIYGDGALHVYADRGRIKFERVLPYEILVDYLESHYGPQSTRTMHRIKNLDRTTLISMFPEKKQALINLSSTNDLLTGTARSVSDTVTVVESWRLPSAPGEDDGLHTIVCPDILLCVEPWDKEFFPIVPLRYSPRVFGFWGQGLAEQLTPIQVELNRCLMTIQRSYHLGGSFKVLMKKGSGIVKSHIDNTIGSIIEYAGDTPPQYVTPPMVPPEIYQHIERLINLGYQQSGISQLSANSQKPGGLDSGEAIRTFADIETDRFQVVGQAYESWFLELARVVVATARDVYEEEGELPVKVPGKKFIQTIDWSDVSLEDDEFVMELFPISKLPSDPEGRLQTIQEMMQGGLIDPQAGRRLLDYPDLDAEENLSNATLDYLHEILDKIVEDGEFTPPEPFDDLATAQKLALEYYALGKRDNLSPARLELLRRFMQQIELLQAPPAPPMDPTSAPLANPEPTPTSDLVPNAAPPTGPTTT